MVGVNGGCFQQRPQVQPKPKNSKRANPRRRGDRIMSAADLGKVIRARRKELGYTQVEVAEMMECSPRLVGEIERGRGSVGFDRIASYAMNLGIDLAAFKR